jgi:hypothetical protein
MVYINLTSFNLNSRQVTILKFSGYQVQVLTGRIYGIKISSLTIKGTNGTVDTLRLVYREVILRVNLILTGNNHTVEFGLKY